MLRVKGLTLWPDSGAAQQFLRFFFFFFFLRQQKPLKTQNMTLGKQNYRQPRHRQGICRQVKEQFTLTNSLSTDLYVNTKNSAKPLKNASIIFTD